MLHKLSTWIKLSILFEIWNQILLSWPNPFHPILPNPGNSTDSDSVEELDGDMDEAATIKWEADNAVIYTDKELEVYAENQDGKMQKWKWKIWLISDYFFSNIWKSDIEITIFNFQ